MSEIEEQTDQNLSREVIAYLSKEIETNTNNIMVYRSKIAFAVFLGPFIILIAFFTALRGQTISSFNLDRNLVIIIISTIIVSACFMTLAYINARIEQQSWEQCNRWRGLIAELHADPSFKIKAKDLSDKLFDRKLRSSKIVYVVAYGVLLLSFIAIIFILVNLPIKESPC